MTLSHLFAGPLGGLLASLLRASLSATVIAALILLFQLFFGRWLTPAWRYRLWAVMAVRLLLPVLPASPLSLSNFDPSGHLRRVIAAFRYDHSIDQTPARVATASIPPPDMQQPKVTVSYGAPPPFLHAQIVQANPSAAPAHQPLANLPVILFFVWAACVVALLARLAGANLQLARRLRHAARATDAALLARFWECCDRAQIHRPPELLLTDAIRIPATAGLWRPRILLPPGLFDDLSDQQQRSVLLHELAHVKCRDILSNWVLALAQIIHWFNPAIRWAIGRLKVDREMARDAMVLRWIGGEDPTVGREQYARTLLNLTQTLCGGPRCLGIAAGLAGVCTPAAWLTSGSFGRSSALKRRLQMIRSSGHQAGRSTLLGSVLVVALVSCTLTRAQNPPPQQPPSTPSRTTPPPMAEERQLPHSDADDMLVAQARALITQHKYDGARAILKEIDAQSPKSKFLIDAVPTLLKEIESQEKGARVTRENLQRQLDRQVPEVSFDGVGFDDVTDFLRDISGANIFVNWKALEAAKIDRNTPVTLRLRGVPFAKVLDVVLDSVGGKQELGYTIDDGVITISTADDLAKNVDVRVYDIRDLLTVSPDFVPPRLGTPQPAGPAAPTTGPSVKAAEQDLHDQMVKNLVQLIEQTVAADGWKDHGGSVGALRELQGQLIVTQTPENQIAVMRLLQQMRENRGVQCTVECRFVSCDEPVARALLAKWQKIATPATLPAGGAARPVNEGAVGLFLDHEQVEQFLQAHLSVIGRTAADAV